ncbi:MAG: hypothetical protein WKF74_11700 [Pyrinomonadaceae bacterium]
MRRPIIHLSFIVLIMLAGSLTARAQNPNLGSQDDDDSRSSRRSKSPLSSPQREIFARAAIDREKALHAEHLERARLTAQLSRSLNDYFARHSSLNSDEAKKLERIEKLARRIRGSAGGSTAEGVLENPPGNMQLALKRLTRLADELRQAVEKTPRQVISAAVIDRSNEILEIIRHIRGMNR